MAPEPSEPAAGGAPAAAAAGTPGIPGTRSGAPAPPSSPRTPGGDRPRQVGGSLRIYVLTAEPGDAVWERFGHNALRIVDEEAGTDIAWNWGLFDFRQQGFVPRLIRGTMLYSMGGFPTSATLESYAAADRAVWSQELDLTPEEKAAVQAAVHENYLPQNRRYRYDYYRDNCSTRIRDVLDAALGGRIRAVTGDRSTGTTYRWHTRRLLRGVPWAYAGIQLVLGNRADEPITAWQEMFVPMRLRDHLGRITVERNGGEVPLVREERLLLASERPPVPAAPDTRWGVALATGLLWAGAVLLLGRAAAAGSSTGRVGLALLAGAWGLVAGLAGLLLGGAWAFTDHVFWRWNENLLQTDPLAVATALGMALLVVRSDLPSWVPGTALLVGALSMLGVFLQLLPGFDQMNGEVLALAVPVNLAVALAARAVAGGTPPPAPGAAPAGVRGGAEREI